MNKTIAKIGSIIVSVTVILFAIFMFISQFGSFLVCIFLALGYLMMIHGLFFFGCLIMPMTGVFSASMSEGSDSIGGIIALEFWCAYFLPIGILSIFHFKKD